MIPLAETPGQTTQSGCRLREYATGKEYFVMGMISSIKLISKVSIKMRTARLGFVALITYRDSDFLGIFYKAASSGNNLIGTLPTELGSLSWLRTISIREYTIAGLVLVLLQC